MDETLGRIKKNYKIAWRGIRFNPMRYLPFFLALLIIQSCLAVFITSEKKAESLESGLYEDDCSYHLIINSANDAQLSALNTYSAQNTAAGLYRIYDVTETEDSVMKEKCYNVKITFKTPVKETYKKFMQKYSVLLTEYGDGEFLYTETPVLEGVSSSSTGFTIGVIAAFAVVAFLLLNVIYGVRITNERFEYGIYMTCGADFKKLVSNSFCENSILSLVAFIPSIIISTTVVSLVFGSFCAVSFWDLILILALTHIESTVSVLIPMKVISKKYPLYHISSSDSSGSVISPRKSVDLLKKTISFFGKISLFRFRKHFAKVIVSACAFSIIGLAVYYLGIVTDEKTKTEQPSFEITLSEYYAYDEDVSAAVTSLDFVTAVEKKCEMNASYIGSHLAVGKGKTLPFSNFVYNHEQQGLSSCTDLVTYRSADCEVLDSLSKYDVTGDLSDGLNYGYCVICPNSYNWQRLNLKVGDSVYIAIGFECDPTTTVSPDEIQLLTGNKLLRAKIDYYAYSYMELKVAAIVNDLPTDELMPIYLSHETYQAIVGEEPVYTSVSVYTEKMKRTESEEFEKELSSLLPKGAFVENTHGHVIAEANEIAQKKTLLFVLGTLILLFCPIVWFYAQSVFYSKRKAETELLEFLGATSGEIFKLYLSDAFYVSLLSAISTAIISFVTVIATFRVMSLFAAASVYYHFNPPILLILCVSFVSALCSFLSVMVCYLSRKKRQSHIESALFDDSSR